MNKLILISISFFAAIVNASNLPTMPDAIKTTRAVIDSLESRGEQSRAAAPKNFVDTSTIKKIRIDTAWPVADKICTRVQLKDSERLVLVDIGFTNSKACYAEAYVVTQNTDGSVTAKPYESNTNFKCELTAADVGIYDGSKSGFSAGN